MTDYPLSIEGAHGRIDAYRFALAQARDALLTAYPYVNGLTNDPNVAPWRAETARTSLQELDRALTLIRAELAVRNPEKVTT